MKQKIAFYITSGLLAVPLFAAVFTTQPALAYKCTGQTSNQQHYYKDGACYQPVGNTCLDNPAPASGEECQNRDTSKDTKVADEQPVKNDGSEIADWECASGTYNATKHVCETCTGFGGCQTNTRVTPTPKGQDTTTDPDTEDPNSTGGTSEDKATKGECAGEKTDFLACDADGADAIIEILKLIILFASVGVGVVAVGGIVYGAILYASAQDSQDQIRKAVVIIRGVLIGLFLYMFMVAILNFLVPGGVFGGAAEDPESSQTGNPADQNNNNSNSGNNTGNNNSNNNGQNANN